MILVQNMSMFSTFNINFILLYARKEKPKINQFKACVCSIKRIDPSIYTEIYYFKNDVIGSKVYGRKSYLNKIKC